MQEEDRIELLKQDADTLDSLYPEDGKVIEITRRMRKFFNLVLNRDAGASIDAKAEITRLQSELEKANQVAREIDEEFAQFREQTKPMAQAYSDAKAKIAELEKQLGA